MAEVSGVRPKLVMSLWSYGVHVLREPGEFVRGAVTACGSRIDAIGEWTDDVRVGIPCMRPGCVKARAEDAAVGRGGASRRKGGRDASDG
jgi:hypothetical protein